MISFVGRHSYSRGASIEHASFDASLIPRCQHNYRLSLLLESLGETAHVLRQAALVAEELDVSTVDLDAASSLALQVLLAAEGSETPVLGDNNFLAARELVLRTTESLQGKSTA